MMTALANDGPEIATFADQKRSLQGVLAADESRACSRRMNLDGKCCTSAGRRTLPC